MITKRWAIGGSLAVAALVAGTLLAPKLARRAAFFRVHAVEVVGLRYLREDDVVRRLHLPAGATTLDDLEAVRKAAQAIPGVVAASVERRFPGTLRVTLLEATPVALAAQDERMVLVDHRGRVLPFDPARVPASLPIIEPDSAAAALLTRVLLADSSWYATIETAQRDRGDVVFGSGAQRVRLRADADGESLRAVAAVREYLTGRGIGWREIDARYRGRVFVRKGSA